jgi:hypothetical protein
MRPAHYAIKRRKILTTFWLLVCSQGSFGSASLSVYTFMNSPHKWTPLHSENGGERLLSKYWDPKGLNSLVILGAWTLWKHRNQCVFDGASPSLAAALSQAEEDRVVWELAGAKGITFLMAQLHGE